MCRSAVIAKTVNLAQEKSPASKLCGDLRDGERRLAGLIGATVNSFVVGIKRVSREARKEELPVTVQQFVHN